MTNQMQGELLFQGWSGTTDVDWAYTPWIPVRADFATFAVEVSAINGSGMTLTWDVQTRDQEDPSTISTILDSMPAMTTATTSVAGNPSAKPAKQLVRYRFKTGSGASTANYVIFRALQPSWQMDR